MAAVEQQLDVATVHDRLHELYAYSVRIDPEAASWTGAAMAAMSEARRNRADSAKLEKGTSWEFEEGRSIRWRPDGIELVIDRGKNSPRIPVITGYLRPERSVVVEGWTYFQVLIAPGQRVTASAEDLLKRLERDGRIRKRKLGHDVLIELLWKMAPDSAAAFPTYGIYSRPAGELEICAAPVPVRDEQLTAHEQLEPGLTYQAQPADVRAYAEFLQFYHPYETMPAMGLAAISPVSHVLRANDFFVPHVWHWSIAHGLGKSLVAIAFSRNLWGRAQVSGSAVNSEFRLSAHLDAANVPLTIDEAENLAFHRLGADLKASAERPVITRRGTTALLMVPYSSRCVLFFTGNRLVPQSGPALSRFLAPRFDSAKLAERRERKPQLDQALLRLRPIGHLLAEQLVQLHPRLESLLQQIRDYEVEIARTGAAQGDIRRAQAWAVTYVGLTVWEALFAAHGVDWKAPSIREFVDKVVVTVDRHTYEGEETVVDAFRSWFEAWRARNVSRVTNIEASGGRERYSHEEEVRGQGSLFHEAELKVGERRIKGYWVTKSLTGEYNRQAAPDLHVGSLSELAASAADEAHVPHEMVLESSGNVKRVAFPNRPSVRAAFVPREQGGE